MATQTLLGGSNHSIKVLYGKTVFSAQPLSNLNLLNKTGSDGNVLCFERAAAGLKPQLPFLTV
ncbi:hypothetical protein H9L39_17558 [Fusarium oxysporum f. sp. albedinis]|nr:hypothetical protein H9L39_17426 [Fusarium oxysporum f. sp. albedinis]KAK2471327.1 hypothetical protein H9L39_17558 [Fusarium oxysporum f. sp. albedinis]